MSKLLNNEQMVQYRTFQWVVFLFSIVFLSVLSNGYYNLLVNKNVALAFLVGVGLAALAWGLAKFIGSSSEKIKGNVPLFVLLLLLSAVGVFNSLMVNLEGKRIFQEAIDDAQDRFRDLTIQTNKPNPAIDEKKARVEKLKTSFEAELKNPQNCGQGPVAMELARQLASELKGFKVLSGSTTCKNIEATIAEYDKTINNLLENSDEFTKENYAETKALKKEVSDAVTDAQAQINKLRTDVNNGGNLLVDARNGLEDVASKYQKIAQKLNGSALKTNVPSTLNLKSVRNLGEWSQIVNLIISRLDQPTTYVYLSLALFFDWILIYFFSKLSQLKMALPNRRSQQKSTNISSPW